MIDPRTVSRRWTAALTRRVVILFLITFSIAVNTVAGSFSSVVHAHDHAHGTHEHDDHDHGHDDPDLRASIANKTEHANVTRLGAENEDPMHHDALHDHGKIVYLAVSTGQQAHWMPISEAVRPSFVLSLSPTVTVELERPPRRA